jgi:hypothetical protein
MKAELLWSQKIQGMRAERVCVFFAPAYLLFAPGGQAALGWVRGKKLQAEFFLLSRATQRGPKSKGVEQRKCL